jgi:hypothetical protein
LVETRSYLVGRSHTRLLTLTSRGRDVLEDLRRDREAERPQAFYDALAKAREVAHDSMVYRAYLRTADRIVERGGRIGRVVLDHELKRDYQRFLQVHNRGRPRATGRPGRDEEEITRWAAEHGLPRRDGHVEFPDVRIEYVDRDEVSRHEDVEVETRKYRGAHAAARRPRALRVITPAVHALAAAATRSGAARRLIRGRGGRAVSAQAIVSKG